MAVDQISRAMAAKALQNDGMLNGRVVTDITLGDSTTPLPKTDGVVNVPKSVVTSGGMKFTRIGNLVIMGGDTWGEVSSAAVPDGYRPAGKQYCLVSYATTEWKPYVGRLSINTDGSIDMYSLDGTWVAQTDGYFIGSCAWLAE